VRSTFVDSRHIKIKNIIGNNDKVTNASKDTRESIVGGAFGGKVGNVWYD